MPAESPDPLPPVPPSPPALSQAWRRLLLQGALAVALATFLALWSNTGDAWDRQVEPWLYLALLLFLAATAAAAWQGRLQIEWVTSHFLLGGTLWLLLKLGLLLTLTTDPQVLTRELAESLIWLPAVLAWSLLAGSTITVPATAVRLVMLLLVPLTLLGGAYWTARAGLHPTAVSALTQLLLASTAIALGMTYFMRKLSAAQSAEAEQRTLARLAYTDLLTGLPNRLSLDQALQEAVQGGEFSLLFVDVDSFKVVNDTMGHAAGDRLLVTVAEVLRGGLRAGGQAFRLSGDEFVVLQPGVGRREAGELARQLQAGLEARPTEHSGVNVSLSIGISHFPQDGRTPQDLLRHADSAMYAVKQAGRGQVRTYEPAFDSRTERFQQLARALGQSRDPQANGFYLEFQPVVDLRTGRTVKAEALLRWQCPGLGAVSPAEFVPVAEKTGQLFRLGRWALHSACSAARAWPVTVSVNVSAVQLSRGDFAAQVAGILEETGLPPQRLELELTETAALYENEQVGPNLSVLRGLGVGISIDGLGAGYSNLVRLRSMDISGVKLDGSLVRDLPDNDEFSHLIAEAVCGLAYHYSLDLTAEGLETPQHVDIVREMGYPLGQGFALCPPLGADALAEHLAQQPVPLAPRV